MRAESLINSPAFAEEILKKVCEVLRESAIKDGSFEVHGIRVDVVREPLKPVK